MIFSCKKWRVLRCGKYIRVVEENYWFINDEVKSKIDKKMSL